MDLSCNIYGLVFNDRVLVFWELGLGFRFSVWVRVHVRVGVKVRVSFFLGFWF